MWFLFILQDSDQVSFHQESFPFLNPQDIMVPLLWHLAHWYNLSFIYLSTQQDFEFLKGNN